MTFQMKLNLSEALAVSPIGDQEYDPELDDVGSILRDVCEALEGAGARFVVRICSDNTWPVTVRTDLAVVMEQLAGVLEALAAAQPTKLELYEQGIEQVVSLVPHRNAVLVECNDLIKKPSSKVTSAAVDRRLVVDELCRLARDFLSAAVVYCGRQAAHPWFVTFARDLSRNADLASAGRLSPPPS